MTGCKSSLSIGGDANLTVCGATPVVDMEVAGLELVYRLEGRIATGRGVGHGSRSAEYNSSWHVRPMLLSQPRERQKSMGNVCCDKECFDTMLAALRVRLRKLVNKPVMSCKRGKCTQLFSRNILDSVAQNMLPPETGGSSTPSPQQPPDPIQPTDMNIETTTTSFKAILLGGDASKQNTRPTHRDLCIDDIDVFFATKDGIPTITFSPKVRQYMSEVMRFTVVIKVVGRAVGYMTLHNRIITMWKLVGDVKIIDLDNNYYLVKLRSVEEYMRALLEGPWTVSGHYLSIQPWSSNFEPMEEKVSSLAVWIRLPGLPLQYYNRSILKAICKPIGKFLKIDNQINEAQRGKFTRLAVELNLNAPLVSRINIDGKVRLVQYEDLYVVCMVCGKFGHNKDSCADYKVDDNKSMEVEIGSITAQPTTLCPGNDTPATPWLVVSRRSKKKVVKEVKEVSKEEGNDKIQQSRYALLSTLETSEPHLKPDITGAEGKNMEFGSTSGTKSQNQKKALTSKQIMPPSQPIKSVEQHTLTTESFTTDPASTTTRQITQPEHTVGQKPCIPLKQIPVTLDQTKHAALAQSIGPNLVILQPKHTRMEEFITLNHRFGNGERPTRKMEATFLKKKTPIKSLTKKTGKSGNHTSAASGKENLPPGVIEINRDVELSTDTVSATTGI